MKQVIFIFIFYFAAGSTNAQINIDSIFLEIDNKDLYVSPVFGGTIVWKHDNSGKSYPARADSNRRMFRVSTFDGDIRSIAKYLTEKKVSVALYKLLSDTARDLYANALLYELLDNRKLGKLFQMDRKKWIESGKREKDIGFWSEYLRSKEYL